MKLAKFLKKKDYIRIKLQYTNTNHFKLKAKINGLKGSFILDTGASNTCIGTEFSEKFKLDTKISENKATGAGTTAIDTFTSEANTIKIGKWFKKDIAFVLIDLGHINAALIAHYSKTIDGIIGADILKKSKAIIDYKKNILYLKKEYFEY